MALLEQLGALGLAAAQVDEDGRVSRANETFVQLTGVSADRLSGAGLTEFLESISAEHKSYGDGAVYRFTGHKGDMWLRPKRGRAQMSDVVILSDVTAEWSMLGKLVASIDVRDRRRRHRDVPTRMTDIQPLGRAGGRRGDGGLPRHREGSSPGRYREGHAGS
jgi:PAS domain-containing protein